MQYAKNRNGLITLLAFLLAIAGLAYLAKGFRVAWNNGDTDLRMRECEWSDFKNGVYPNLIHTPAGRTPANSHTVYPAYAFPMFAPFLAPGNFLWARIFLQLSSLGALAAMMFLGWRVLNSEGLHAGMLGMVLPFAISGNCSALALGQFSIISSGFIAAQILFVSSGRPVFAGLCWSLAMIKPQIAFPFALLFLIQGQWVGLIAGGIMLAGLSFLALKWTGWSIVEYLVYSPGSERLSFMADGNFFLGGVLPISPRLATGVGIAVVCLAGIWILITRGGLKPAFLLLLAGLAAMLGWVMFYHRQYDNQMLFPLMLAVLVLALREKRWFVYAVAALLALCLYLPASLVENFRLLSLLDHLGPIAASVILLFFRYSLENKKELS